MPPGQMKKSDRSAALGKIKILLGREKIVPISKEIKNVPNRLSDAGGLTDCGNINSRETQALELHCGDLLNCHRYFRLGASLTADEKGCS